MKCIFIKIRDYTSIVLLLLSHVKQKWKVNPKKIAYIIAMMTLGIILPFIASELLNDDIDSFTSVVTSFSMGLCGIGILIVHTDIPISRVIYEARYFKRMLTFMVESYQNLIQEYKTFLKIHKLDTQRNSKASKDLTVLGIIFFQIFKLYFKAMDMKQKNSEPFLIDTQEMENLYHSKNFNNFYSTLFFDAECRNYNTSYEQILIHILEEVMTALYQKSWFVEYYDEYTVFQLIKHILTHWYGNIVQYNIHDELTVERSS